MRPNTQIGFSNKPGSACLPAGRKHQVSSPALKAACLTASLATAFALGADNSAHAQTVTGNGNEIFGLALVETDQNGQITIPVPDSRPIRDAPADAKGIAVFTEFSTELVGVSFEDQYGVSEDLVLSYLVDGNLADKASYDTFLANLPENFILNSTYTTTGADHFPGYVVLFSDGKNIGNFGLSSYPIDTHYSGFGVALEPAAVPEPGAVLTLLLGGLGVAGQQTLWRRRTHVQRRKTRVQRRRTKGQ